ncbi:hypothetical protein NT6N_21530 [Oceaniferula spumae]|uniref:Chondroitin AC lyase n=1 Tax=Oceaniferula spumae TaxID=2979115 RepID=A0AAT9FMD1_9BACT
MATATFGKLQHQVTRVAATLQPYFASWEKDPELQLEVLAARAELLQYFSCTTYNRSVFGEGHHGTNDIYSGGHNLMQAWWEVAGVLDSPYINDAAVTQMDTHFRYSADLQDSLTSDGSFTFHNVNGRQLHMTGYGVDWFRGVMRAPRKRMDSPWGMTREQYRRLTRYVEAFEWIFYKGRMSFQTAGRHNSGRGTNGVVKGFANTLLGVPEELQFPETRAALKALVKRIDEKGQNSIQGHRYFYKNLFTVHRREDWFIETKMISHLSGGPETFGGRYTFNLLFGDDTHFLRRSGTEYDVLHTFNANGPLINVRPNSGTPSMFWYRTLPGVTGLDNESAWLGGYRAGAGPAAGGISDGKIGNSGSSYINKDTCISAWKLYGFTEQGMMVLNAAINFTHCHKMSRNTPEASVRMRTSLNQAEWRDEVVVYMQNGEKKVYPAPKDGGKDLSLHLPLDQRYFVTHDGIGYLVMPTGQEMGDTLWKLDPKDPLAVANPGLKMEKGRGFLDLRLSTRDVLTPAPGTPDKLEKVEALVKSGKLKNRTVKVFHLSIDHGRRPVNGRCAYEIFMDAATVDVAKVLKEPAMEILSATADVVAMRDKRTGVLHALFGKAGELKDPASGKLLMKSQATLSAMWKPEGKRLFVQCPKAAVHYRGYNLMLKVAKPTLYPALTGFEKERALEIPLPGTKDPDDRFKGRFWEVEVK